MEQIAIPNPEPQIENDCIAPMLAKPFILPRSIKWVPSTPGELLVKNKLSAHIGSAALKQLNPIHKMGP